MFLVTGATGNVGSELVRALADGGQPVRALTRNGSNAGVPAGVPQVAGDLNDPEGLKATIPGCQSIEKLSDTEMTAKVKAKVGPVSATFTGAGAGKFVESWAGAGKAIIGPAAPKASHQRA